METARQDAHQCWQCEKPAAHDLFCSFCHTLQRPVKDYYRFFGMDEKLRLNAADLQRRFYQLSRLLHPDRYTMRSQQEREYSLAATAILNDGYRILRDPIRRAEYILAAHGMTSADPRTDVDPELLEEVFEMNMAVEELRSGDHDARPQIEQARGRFVDLRADSDRQLDDLFVAWDDSRQDTHLTKIRALLDRRRYIDNLISEVDKVLSQ